MKVFDRPFFRKAWWRVNVVVLASASDATLMLDFCEVQHPKLNRRAALGRARRRETPKTAFNLRSKYVLLSCGYIAKKKNGETYLNVKRKRK
jgi:hypothetical protein